MNERLTPGRVPHLPEGPARPAAWRLFLLPLIAVLVLLGAGAAVWRVAWPRATAVPVSRGPLAPVIVASTIDGGSFSLAAQRGRVVVLYSMAAWCTACVPEATALGQVASTFGGKKVVTLMVDESPQSDSPQAVRGFRARSQGPSRYWIVDRGGSIARAFGIAALESTVVIDSGGHIAAHYSTSTDLATLTATVRSLL